MFVLFCVEIGDRDFKEFKKEEFTKLIKNILQFLLKLVTLPISLYSNTNSIDH